ncbi:MAG: hypothetical protein OEU86_02595 [Gammaproteobacteria bacterium]|nr:hypothetical protein [Gammaproteobacteria bacterium]
MKKLRLLICALLLAGLTHFLSLSVFADDQAGMTLDEAVVMVKLRTGGRILRAETRERNGRRIHRIRVLTEDGHVRTFVIDAERGRAR